jgi:hypothetical protein
MLPDTSSIADIITAVGGIVGALLVIVGIVVKLTKTKKDDLIFETVKNVVEPVVEAVDHKKPKV